MPLTFPCSCGAQLHVPDGGPVYFVRCPMCRATVRVPDQSEIKKDPGFEVVPEKPYHPAFDGPKTDDEQDEWLKSPYEKPSAKNGYKARAVPNGPRGAIQGTGEYEPHEVSQEEFDEDLVERRERRKNRKAWQAMAFGVLLLFAIVAFVFAGKFTQMIDPHGKGKIGAGLARLAILFSFLVIAFILWVVRQLDED